MLSVEILVPFVPAGTVSPLPCRPAAFCEHYLAIRPVPYRFMQSLKHPSSSGGVLCAGQAVWLEASVQRSRLPASVQAFVENVGFVSLDPHLIKKGDGSLFLL